MAVSTHEGREDTGMSAQFTTPLELQQLLLNIFKDTLALSKQPDLQSTVQEVKGHLYRRDFQSAFGKEEYLKAYAGRWSPSRALAYVEIFNSPEMQPLWYTGKTAEPPPPTPKVICIGGGAGAEVVALAGLINLHDAQEKLSMVAVDLADWSNILITLEQSITSPPSASRYALPSTAVTGSAPTRAASSPLVDRDALALEFNHSDILNMPEPEMRLLLGDVTLITLLFTLNELFSTSINKATGLLLTLTDVVAPGTMLLVVDSPGSYSEVSLGKSKALKQYPMVWLLNHVLLETTRASPKASSKWENMVSDGSRWFRVNEKLKYPLPLENIRYQIHLYRRI